MHGLTKEKRLGLCAGRRSERVAGPTGHTMAKNQKCGRCNRIGHNRTTCTGTSVPAPAPKARKASLRQRIELKKLELQELESALNHKPATGDIDPTGGAYCPKVPEKFGGPTRQSVVAKGAKSPLRCNFCGVWLVSPGSLKTHVGLMKRAMRTNAVL